MNSFYLLFDDWECAQDAATRESCRICRQLDEYCEGRGAAPAPADVARAKSLIADANARLLAIRSYVAAQRRRVPVI